MGIPIDTILGCLTTDAANSARGYTRDNNPYLRLAEQLREAADRIEAVWPATAT